MWRQQQQQQQCQEEIVATQMPHDAVTKYFALPRASCTSSNWAVVAHAWRLHPLTGTDGTQQSM